MKVQIVLGSRDAEVPKVASAPKLLNYAMKTFPSFVRWREMGGQSNPYLDFQRLRGRMDKKDQRIFMKQLRDQGWKRDDDPRLGSIVVFDNGIGGSVHFNGTEVAFHGRKKAKPITLPYYD